MAFVQQVECRRLAEEPRLLTMSVVLRGRGWTATVVVKGRSNQRKGDGHVGGDGSGKATPQAKPRLVGLGQLLHTWKTPDKLRRHDSLC
jgi:hypothetical protein